MYGSEQLRRIYRSFSAAEGIDLIQVLFGTNDAVLLSLALSILRVL